MIFALKAMGLAALLLAASTPVLAGDIDPANPPPWPAGRYPDGDIPSRLDKASPQDLVAAARTGAVEGTVVLGRRIAARDPALLAWAQAGAARGEPEALTVLGRFHYGNGEVDKGELGEALRLFRQAAQANHPEAMRRLAGFYASGQIVEKDLAAAQGWWRRAAEAGDAMAMFALSNSLYGTPEGDAWRARSQAARGPQPPSRKMPWQRDPSALIAAAQAGDVAAMRELGAVYDGAMGRPRDAVGALYWYRMAADRGDLFAMAQAGQIYIEGRAGRPNREYGLYLLNKAADAGVPVAMYFLAQAYKTGRGVAADPELERTWRYHLFWAPELAPSEPRLAPAPQ